MAQLDSFLDRVLHDDCRDRVPDLPDDSIDGVLIDPPYGEGMGYEGDGSMFEAEELLLDFLKLVEPKLKRSAHVAIFWTMRGLDVCVDAVRSAGYTYRRTLGMYLPAGAARPYLGWLPRTQAIVICQKYLPKPPTEFHRDMAVYLAEAVEASGLSRNQIARSLGCDNRLVMKWTRPGDPAWCLPTPRFYKPLKELLGLDETFDLLLTREPAGGVLNRDDFEYRHDTYVVDGKNERMLHPSQKPLAVIEHLVTCLAPLGGVVLDGFAGSGTTAVACRNTGRHFIAVEKSAEFIQLARRRLAEEKLPCS